MLVLALLLSFIPVSAKTQSNILKSGEITLTRNFSEVTPQRLDPPPPKNIETADEDAITIIEPELRALAREGNPRFGKPWYGYRPIF
jgi:hypothetical protein